VNPMNATDETACSAFPQFAICLALLLACGVIDCQGQGTVKFDGQPVGTTAQIGTYTESGVIVSVIAPGSLFLSGGGIMGYPDDGTGYLEIPDATPGSGGVSFALTSGAHFNLVSFDGARYANLAPPTLELIGYKVQIMGPVYTVTNYITLAGGNFQTLSPDSNFQDLFRVDVINAPWSLDNLIITGVPEPSFCAVAAAAAAAALARARTWSLPKK
jgi:hypothetical protein